MSDLCKIVPWYNSEEWFQAYNDIYSDTSNKQVALNLLITWKARCPSLPSGIESTLSLLQVHVQDVSKDNDIANEEILRLAYSTAIMRFVNHMLDSETAKGSSLYKAAKNLGVPDWIIDLRHDTAHNNVLPSITLLRSACIISLQWLQINYWDKHKEFITDYSCRHQDTQTYDDEQLSVLMNFLTCLSICKHAEVKTLGDLPNEDMRESLANDARMFLDSVLDFSNLNRISIKKLVNKMELHIKKHLNAKNAAACINRSLLGEESLFLSVELLNFTSKYDFCHNQSLNANYVQCFEMLLTILHTNDLIYDLIMALIETTKHSECPTKAQLAALWVSEILKALKMANKFIERAKRMRSNATISKKKYLKQLYHHWFPNEDLECLVLNLNKAVPSKLTDISVIQPIISSYNPYLIYYVNDLLALVDPSIPKQVSQKICHLAKLISTPEKFPVEIPSKIYTIEDLEEKDGSSDIEINDMELSGNKISNDTFKGIWNLASKIYNWGSCPIGMLPHKVTTDMLMEC